MEGVEVLGIVLEALGTLLWAFIKMLWELLPTMLELKKIADLFTPMGLLAAYLGVPMFVVTLLFGLLRKVFEGKI